eukprot:1491305-Prymnesium_polylepis.1
MTSLESALNIPCSTHHVRLGAAPGWQMEPNAILDGRTAWQQGCRVKKDEAGRPHAHESAGKSFDCIVRFAVARH